ncbi:MAG: hypothetical protein ACOVQU_09280, partial [Exiguobacterium acetylicum]
IHDVGDLFSIEMVMPAPFWDHPALVKLLNLPGVYTFDYDASVQSSVRRRVWVICNHPFMAYACGETVRSLLPPERWAVLFTDFLIACSRVKSANASGVATGDCCVHCVGSDASVVKGDGITEFGKREIRRRVTEGLLRFGFPAESVDWDELETAWCKDRPFEAVLRVGARLGARYGGQSFSFLPPPGLDLGAPEEKDVRESSLGSSISDPELLYYNHEEERAHSAAEVVVAERESQWVKQWLESPRDAFIPLGPSANPPYPPEALVSLDRDVRDGLLAALRSVRWPPSIRSYVKGSSECVGLTCSTNHLPRITVAESSFREAAKVINGWLGVQYARRNWNVYWTALQINANTVADWHVDYKNDGLSTMVVVGEFTGGQFELEGFAPLDLQGKAVLFDGTQRHRNVAASGERYSVVAFTNSAWVSCTEKQLDELRSLGFRVPGEGPLVEPWEPGVASSKKSVRVASAEARCCGRRCVESGRDPWPTRACGFGAVSGPVVGCG